ncbi:c-type cytochrome [Savagea faecisuis]|uniref:C-type cytochrome n=1 Tax=Savagea faecisuis TaxID=1274803 RepID=A0ABW3GSP4_9BACL
MNNKKGLPIPLIASIFVLGLIMVLSMFGMQVAKEKRAEAPKETEEVAGGEETTAPAPVAGGKIAHNPPSLDDVPEGPLGEAILRGYELTNNTSEVLRSEAATPEDGEKLVNELSCTSCHAGAGMDEHSSSMVGVSAVYPMYIPRSGKIVTLEDRINGCMIRSMNGQKFEANDPDLKAMVAYLTYISEGIPVGAELDWRHLNNMDDVPVPDVDAGEQLYNQSCIACHAGDGSGTGSNTGPALWGSGSFNDGAGLARMGKMAGYIQRNMPIGQENSLSDQEAADLAAFILSQDRDSYPTPEKDWPNGDRPSDIMDKEKRDQVKNGTIDWNEVLGKN